MEQMTFGGIPAKPIESEAIIWQGRPVPGVLRNPVHIGFGQLENGNEVYKLMLDIQKIRLTGTCS